MKKITIKELKALKNSKDDFQLIDVREQYEFDACNLGGELIPLGNIPHHFDKISRDKKVIFYCKSGMRSLNAAKWLEKKHNFDNLYSLEGGIVAWAHEVDSSMKEKFL